ncbi:MAG: DUF5666 domain-containing protein, partial [Acidobacteriota bacterium]
VTAISSTSITIGGVTYAIAPGTTLSGANLVTAGVNACLSATLNASGQIIVPSSITVQAGTTVNVCGVVTAISSTSITINGVTYAIFPGTVINGANLVTVGVNACLSATINATGQIIVPSSITVQAGTTVNVCGVVTAISSTSITIGGVTYVIAPGNSITGANLVTAGVNACLSATLNASGQIVLPSSITVQGSATINICGVVTAISSTSITINGITYGIFPGTSIDGASLVTVGVNACLSATINATGQIIPPSSINVQAGTTLNVCGIVTAISSTSITIGGVAYPIAAGTVISGANLVTIGVNACLSATINATGQIVAPSSITVQATAVVHLCGVVTAYVAATASVAGSITIGGTTLPIAAGTVFGGAALITIGADLCLSATLNINGQVVPPSSVTFNVSTTVSLCGTVTAYTAATATAPGSITIGGTTLSIAAGTVLSGSSLIVIGANLCISVTLSEGQIIPPSGVTPNVTPVTVLCGVVSAFTAATATAAGSITIGGVTYVIAPGVILSGTGLITIGANLCLSIVPNSQGEIISSTVIIGVGSSVSLCGVVTAFVGATVSTAGSVTINGTTLGIAAGTVLTGQAFLQVGASVSVTATLNALGQITMPSSASACSGSSISLCGLLTAFVAATATSPGSITIGGVTLVIAPNTILSGQALLILGTNVCLTSPLNPIGEIINPGPVVPGDGPIPATEVCGVVTAFTPATANAIGSLTIGGTTFTIGVGVTLVGQELITIGSTLCVFVVPPVNPGPGPGTELGPATVVSVGGASCPLVQLHSPLGTHGFAKSTLLPDGDLFLLQQTQTLTIVSPFATGIEVFQVNPATFGGSAFGIGGFPGTSLQGLSLSAPSTRVEAVTCTDNFRKVDFELAGTAGAVGDVVRLFVQNSDGNGDVELARLTVEAGGLRVTSLNANVTLFRNNRLASGAGQLTAGSLIEMSIAAGSAGLRTQLLTLALSRNAPSLNKCVQLGVELTRGGNGKTSIVFTDFIVDRVEVAGDRLRPELGLIAGGGGGYPTGMVCGIVCPACAMVSAIGTLTTVSAASFSTMGIAPEAIVASFGSGLAVSSASATTIPLPTLLLGTSVQVKDSKGVSRIAPLFFVSAGQVNFQIPPGTALGTAIISITSGSGSVSTETVQVVAVAPSLFTANTDGQGVAAAVVLRVRADNSQTIEAVARFDATQGKMIPVPIDLGLPTDRVFLVLFGTGIRFRTDLASVSAKVGGVDAQVTYAGPQGTFVGLDQVNLLLARSLIGRGEVDVSLLVNGKAANTVSVNIR